MLSLPILDLLQDCDDPPLTRQAIKDIEIALRVRFPEEYADFLAQFNGGEFYRDVGFELPYPRPPLGNGGRLKRFFGEPADGIEHNGMIWVVNTVRDRIPEDFIPIADCNFDDYILLRLVGYQSEFQGVWFWDSTADEGEPSVHWLNDSFNGFLAMLEPNLCDEEDERESLPLFQAIEHGNLTAVARYLAEGGDIEARNEHGYTLLTAAAIHQRPKIVRLLLENSANTNARDDLGCVPLHYAATHSIDSVKHLLAAGADATARDNAGQSVLGNWSYRADQILRRHGAKE